MAWMKISTALLWLRAISGKSPMVIGIKEYIEHDVKAKRGLSPKV
jgi:hypothetical protein